MGMVDHDLVYKQEASELKDELSEAADLLRILLSASDAICMYMKEKDQNNIEQEINICIFAIRESKRRWHLVKKEENSMLMENREEKVTQMGKNFVKKLISGEILEASRPNKGHEYTGAYEQLDLLEYQRFLHSYTYTDLFANVEVEYGQY